MEEDETWFAKPADPGISRLFRFSQVSFFVDAEEYFADLRREVESTGKGGMICWIGFEAGGYDAKDSVVDVLMPASAAQPAAKPFARRTRQEGDRSWFDL